MIFNVHFNIVLMATPGIFFHFFDFLSERQNSRDRISQFCLLNMNIQNLVFECHTSRKYGFENTV